MTTMASTIEPAATRSSPPVSSCVRRSTSWSNSRARVTTPVTNCMMTATSTPERNGAMSPMTFVRLEASARAPAWGR
jgi:hypothetical protein